jgi:hypothetical protein
MLLLTLLAGLTPCHTALPCLLRPPAATSPPASHAGHCALLLSAGTAQVAPSLVAHVLATGAVRSMPLSACLPNLPAVLDSIRPYQQQTPARERSRWGHHLQGWLLPPLALSVQQQQTALPAHLHAALQPDQQPYRIPIPVPAKVSGLPTLHPHMRQVLPAPQIRLLNPGLHPAGASAQRLTCRSTC